MSPRDDVIEFFDARLPALLEARAELAATSRATITVFVQGAGQWTVTLGPDAAVSPEPSLEADLIVTWSAEQFASLLAGEAVVPPVALGDASRLDVLGRLLLPPARGGLGARLAMCA